MSPVPLEAIVTTLESRSGERFDPVPLSATKSSASVLRSPTSVAYVATDAASSARLAIESQRLEWARRADVPVPKMIEFDPEHRWLLLERVADDKVHGAGYVDAAVAAAARFAAASEPLPSHAPLSRRPERRGLGIRLARGVASPLRLAEFRGLRTAVAELPRDTVVHGDFHDDNVLSDAGRSVHVVDFEFLGLGPAGSDLAELWANLADPADRRRLLDVAIGSMPRLQSQLLLLIHWAAVRHLGDLVTPVARARRDRVEVELARDRVAEARSLRR